MSETPAGEHGADYDAARDVAILAAIKVDKRQARRLRRRIPSVLTDLPEPKGNHCPGCGWSSGGHDPKCPIASATCPDCDRDNIRQGGEDRG